MKHRKRNLIAVLGAAALVATGCGAAGSDDTAQSAATAGQSTSQPQQQSGQPPQGGGGPDVSGLADTLGVDETKLQEAMASLRPDRAAGDDGAGTGSPAQPPDRTEMAAELAEALGLDEQVVADALADAMPTPPATTSPPSGRA